MENKEVYRTTKYTGSKSLQLDKIYKYFIKDFDVYLEPFFGSAAVYMNLPIIDQFRKKFVTRKQLPNFLLNDFDNEMVELAYVLLTEPDRIYNSFNNFLKVEGLHKIFRKMDSNDIDDYYLRVIRKLYLIYTSHGGKELSSFRYEIFNQSGRFSTLYPNKNFALELQIRLSLAYIFNDDWKHFLDRFLNEEKLIQAEKHNKTIFMYLDPPYLVKQKHYKFMKIDHKDLAIYLNELSNKTKNVFWVLSYNDVSEIRELYQDFFIYSEEWNYSGTTGNVLGEEVQKGQELIITNFQLKQNSKKDLKKFFL